MTTRTIYLEESDDEIQVLSPRKFQARNQPRRRNGPVIVDVEQETRSGLSGDSVDDLVIVSSHSYLYQQQKFPPNGTIINCESYSKEKKASKPEIVQMVVKEPIFSCPICMCEITSPFSTSCGHIFCEGCIKAAIGVKKQCPTCRTKLAAKNTIHKVFLPNTTAAESDHN